MHDVNENIPPDAPVLTWKESLEMIQEALSVIGSLRKAGLPLNEVGRCLLGEHRPHTGIGGSELTEDGHAVLTAAYATVSQLQSSAHDAEQCLEGLHRRLADLQAEQLNFSLV
jgi:hypothetical protein